MNDPKELVEKILLAAKSAMPETLAEDVKSNVLAVIQSTLQEMDVVSREELEIQTEVLQKTRAKLEVLETQLQEIEARLNK